MKSFISTKPLLALSVLCLSGMFVGVQAQSLIGPERPVAPVVQIEAPEVIAEDSEEITEEETIVDEYIPIEPAELIEDRLSCLPAEIKLNYNNVVKGFIDYFTVRNRNYTKLMIERRDVYFPIFEKYLKKHNMPDELKYLAIVESGLNPRAKSRVGAVGLWQFMPGTGRELRLYQDAYIDERMDPYKATEAACIYLKSLYNMFGDWQLALASYNCGPGNVRRAMRKANSKESFWDVYNYLPKETRAYVPQFIAVTYAMNYTKEHNFNLDSILVAIPHDTIVVNNFVNMEQLAKHMEVDFEDLRYLNPELKKDVVPDYRKNYPIRIPADKKEFFNLNRLAILDSAAQRPSNIAEPVILLASNESQPTVTNKKKIVYTVRRGDGLIAIADKHNVSVQNIKRWNKLRRNSLKAGQKLTIWKMETSSQKLLASATSKPKKEVRNDDDEDDNKNKKSKIKAPKEKIYRVQPGDTLWLISQKHEGISVERIMKLNKLKGKSIKPGQKLIIG